jgi:O-antigen/teichoic acid export membrane protein
MVRSTAQCRAEERTAEIRQVFLSGLIFEIALGLVLSAVAFGLSGFLANNVFHRPEIVTLIQIASVSILAGGVINAATAAFTGTERMELNSVMLICQSIVKILIIITLVVLGLGTTGAVAGYMGGLAFGALVGVVLMWVIYKKLPKPSGSIIGIKACTKAMLTYGTPISLGTIISSFQTQFFAFLLPIFYLSNNSIIGNYNLATTFVVLITFFATPVTTMMFPAFSKLDAQKDKGTIRNVFQFSVKYASLLVVPVAALVMSLAEPAVSTLFGSSYSSTGLFLALLSITYLYTAFGNLSTVNLIISQGQTKLSLYLTIITAAIGFPMGYILVNSFGALGLITTTLTAGLPSIFLSLRLAKKKYDVSVDWGASARILLSAGVAATLTFALVSYLNWASWTRLVIGVLFFVFVFVFSALLTRAVSRSDVNNLRQMAGGFGFISALLTRVLNLVEKLMTILRL